MSNVVEDVFLGREKNNKRKAFSPSTKRIEWERTEGRCRGNGCHRKLIWGSGEYNFDHANNNHSDNSQKNCALLCNICHGKETRISSVKVNRGLFGDEISRKVKMKKKTYNLSKLTLRKKSKSKRKRRQRREGNVLDRLFGSPPKRLRRRQSTYFGLP